MAQLTLRSGKVILLDKKDLKTVMKYHWCLGGLPRRRYAHNRRLGTLHRFLMGAKKGEYVDHINGDTLDNRRANLRICTKSQNQMNMKKCRKETLSRYKGVSFHRISKLWQARVKMNGKVQYSGYFRDEKDAALAYNENAKRLFGTFALLNDVGHTEST